MIVGEEPTEEPLRLSTAIPLVHQVPVQLGGVPLQMKDGATQGASDLAHLRLLGGKMRPQSMHLELGHLTWHGNVEGCGERMG